MKHFLQFMRKESADFRRPILVAIIAAGIINGVGVTIAMTAVRNLKQGQVDVRSFLLFLACIVGYWVSKEVVLNRTTVILEQIIERLRWRILYKIKETDTLPFESMDKGRIYATLSSDALSISTSAGMVINATSSLVMLVFTFGILAFLSMKALLMTIGLIGVAVLYYMYQGQKVSEQLAAASVKENEFFDNLNGLLNGFKELKLSREKSSDYFLKELEAVIHATNLKRVEAGKGMNHGLLVAHTYQFFTLAGLIYVLPMISPGETSIVPILVPVVLFAGGPLADVVSAIPALAKAEISIINIYDLEASIDKGREETIKRDSAAPQVVVPAVFENLRCERLTFQYPSVGRHAFKIQPTDLELKAGQIVFLVGGNGSGKSTLLKLITGLYHPNGGRILLNGEEIHEENVVKLREMFSPIFTDFHLFKRVLGNQPLDKARIDELLARMELSDKTDIVDGCVTNMNLSTGQRKRLALVLSTLDNRPVHLFDEWAADQDPVFRKFFYEVLLRQMAREGKTILAATHDDHYFHVADKVFMMEYGRLVPYKPVLDAT